MKKRTLPCAVGTYNDERGRTECKACPAGRFATEEGSTACDPCPVGGYCAAIGASSVRQTFTACPNGTYNPDLGALNVSSCLTCVAGKANPVPGSSTSSSCLDCLQGSYSGADGEGRCAPTDGHDSGAARPPAQLAELSQAELQRTGVVSTAQRTAGFQGALSLVEKAEQLKTVLGVTGNLVEVASSAAELLDLAPLAPADGRPLNVVLNQCYELIS